MLANLVPNLSRYSNFSTGTRRGGCSEGRPCDPGRRKDPLRRRDYRGRITSPIEGISRGLMIIIHRARDDSDNRRDRQTCGASTTEIHAGDKTSASRRRDAYQKIEEGDNETFINFESRARTKRDLASEITGSPALSMRHPYRAVNGVETQVESRRDNLLYLKRKRSGRRRRVAPTRGSEEERTGV